MIHASSFAIMVTQSALAFASRPASLSSCLKGVFMDLTFCAADTTRHGRHGNTVPEFTSFEKGGERPFAVYNVGRLPCLPP